MSFTGKMPCCMLEKHSDNSVASPPIRHHICAVHTHAHTHMPGTRRPTTTRTHVYKKEFLPVSINNLYRRTFAIQYITHTHMHRRTHTHTQLTHIQRIKMTKTRTANIPLLLKMWLQLVLLRINIVRTAFIGTLAIRTDRARGKGFRICVCMYLWKIDM